MKKFSIVIIFTTIATCVALSGKKVSEPLKSEEKFYVHYKESSVKDSVSYDRMMSLVKNPTEDLEIRSKEGELIFEYKD
jgi:hypothetical protein